MKLRHYVTGAIERGEKKAIVAVTNSHSPGPWSVSNGGPRDTLTYIVDDTGSILSEVHSQLDSILTEKRNARLIAAAPDLYAQVVILLDELYRISGCALSPRSELISKAAIEALDKAKGH